MINDMPRALLVYKRTVIAVIAIKNPQPHTISNRATCILQVVIPPNWRQGLCGQKAGREARWRHHWSRHPEGETQRAQVGNWKSERQSTVRLQVLHICCSGGRGLRHVLSSLPLLCTARLAALMGEMAKAAAQSCVPMQPIFCFKVSDPSVCCLFKVEVKETHID